MSHSMWKAIVCLVCLAAAGTFAGQARAANPSDFQVINYDHVNGSGSSALYMPGRLYVPTGYNPAQTYPMVMFLHGSGEAGTNNTSQVNVNIDNLLAAAKSRNFFLFAPQSDGAAWQSGQYITAMKMVSMIAGSYNIDASRLYVTGLSYGGSGTWFTLGDYRDVFAAGVPLVASGGYSNPAWLVGKPVWSYEARQDQFLDVGRNVVNAIRAADRTNPTYPSGKPALSFPLNNSPSNPNYNNGAPYYSDGSTFYSDNNQRYSEYYTGGHSTATWGRAYNESWMYDWLLSQSHQPHSLQPGETILFDLGAGRGLSGLTTDSKGRVWNSDTTYMEQASLGPVIPYAKTSAGIATTVTMSLDSAFYTAVTYPGPQRGVIEGSMYDPEIAEDSWISRSDKIGVLTLKGLTPGQRYRVSCFASDNDNDGGLGRLTRYTIGTQSITLDIVNNTVNAAVFDSVMADAAGQLQLTVAPEGTARYAEIGAIEVTAVPEPGTLILLGGGAAGLWLGLWRRRARKKI